MNGVFGKPPIWIFSTLAAAAMTFAAVQQLPEGEGKKLIEAQCGACHSLEQAVAPKLNLDEWKKLVEKMVGFGAQLDGKQVDTAVDYLSKNFGPPASSGSLSEDDKTALKHIAGICSTCHDSVLIKSTQATKEEWLEIVKKMNSKGAGLSDVDVELLADYLARNYGRK